MAVLTQQAASAALSAWHDKFEARLGFLNIKNLYYYTYYEAQLLILEFILTVNATMFPYSLRQVERQVALVRIGASEGSPGGFTSQEQVEAALKHVMPSELLLKGYKRSIS